MTNVPPRLKANARSLRRNATDAERVLWYALRLYRPRFTRQLVVGGAIADFACRKARLVVELDGGQHDECARDERRTTALEAAGWRVIRFWNHDVLGNTDGVMEVILAAVASRLPEGPTPCPLPEIREGKIRRPRRR
jgi:very-short-patch-repair endonuclease